MPASHSVLASPWVSLPADGVRADRLYVYVRPQASYSTPVPLQNISVYAHSSKLCIHPCPPPMADTLNGRSVPRSSELSINVTVQAEIPATRRYETLILREERHM